MIGAVDLLKQFLGAFGFHTDHDAVWVEKIDHRVAFAQELRVRGDLEGSFGVAVAIKLQSFVDSLAGQNRDRALFDHELIGLGQAGDLTGDAFDTGEIGVPARQGRRAEAKKDDFTVLDALSPDSR